MSKTSRDFYKEMQKRLEKLPNWARVAFAARCARRVQPLFGSAWRYAHTTDVLALDRAITLAEQTAAAPEAVGDSYTYRIAVSTTYDAADNADAGAAGNANAAAQAANDATRVAALAVANAHFNAVAVAANAASSAAVTAVAADAIRLDLLRIEYLASEEGWTNDTSVPPGVFGSLWPDGPPENWPAETSEDLELVLELDVPDDATDDEIKQRIVELTGGLDDMHRSHGGHGLQIKGIEIPRAAPVCEGVPS